MRMILFVLSTDDEKPQEQPRRRWHAVAAGASGIASAVLGGLLLPPVQEVLGYLLH